jgi:hypothetical protein
VTLQPLPDTLATREYEDNPGGQRGYRPEGRVRPLLRPFYRRIGPAGQILGMIRPPPRETEVTHLHHDRSAPHAALPASADGQRLVQQARAKAPNVPAVISQPHDTHVVHADESSIEWRKTDAPRPPVKHGRCQE